MPRIVQSSDYLTNEMPLIVPVGLGGTGADNIDGACTNLNAVKQSELNQPDGPVSLINDKIDSQLIDTTTANISAVSISGSTTGAVNQTLTFIINNYDIATAYEVSATAGSISRINEIITWVLPSTPGNYSFTINGQTYNITVTTATINRPAIISPANGSTNHGPEITFTSSTFSTNGGYDTHVSSSWQLATDAQFSNIVASVNNSTTAKTSWTVTNLSPATQYFARVRYTGANYGTSDWSNAISVSTKANFYVYGNEQSKLISTDGAAYDYFGFSVAINSSGNTAVIGAYGDDDNGTDSGSVYIFVRSNSSWTQQAKLGAPDGAANDNFGSSVAISGDGNTVIVGSYGDDDNGSNSGSAYIFVRNNNNWSFQYKLTPPDGAANDNFGRSVAISSDGNTAIIGAGWDDDNGTDSGSAYICVRNSNNTWSFQYKITPSDGAANDHFGYSVAISGDGNYVIIGAPDKDSNGTDSGAAYVYIKNNTTWSFQVKLVPTDAGSGDLFGYSVDINYDGSAAIIGSPNDDSNKGSAYVFTRSGNIWTQQTKLLATDGIANDYFGKSVAISNNGNYVIIGATGEDDKGTDAGSVYIFIRSANIWSQHAKLSASDGAANDQFGISVDISGDSNSAIVGAYYDDDRGTDSGSAYIYI